LARDSHKKYLELPTLNLNEVVNSNVNKNLLVQLKTFISDCLQYISCCIH
jgi:hypothetical protein